MRVAAICITLHCIWLFPESLGKTKTTSPNRAGETASVDCECPVQKAIQDIQTPFFTPFLILLTSMKGSWQDGEFNLWIIQHLTGTNSDCQLYQPCSYKVYYFRTYMEKSSAFIVLWARNLKRWAYCFLPVCSLAHLKATCYPVVFLHSLLRHLS